MSMRSAGRWLATATALTAAGWGLALGAAAPALAAPAPVHPAVCPTDHGRPAPAAAGRHLVRHHRHLVRHDSWRRPGHVVHPVLRPLRHHHGRRHHHLLGLPLPGLHHRHR